MKLAIYLAFWSLAGWVAWRVCCRVEKFFRPLKQYRDNPLNRATERELDRAGMSRVVDLARWQVKMFDKLEPLVDASNARATERGDRREAEAEARRAKS